MSYISIENKYTLTHEHIVDGESEYKISIEFDKDQLSDILENMELFLAGCGFELEGSLVIEPGEPVTILNEKE